MLFTVKLQCDNAAFGDQEGPANEIARILRRLAHVVVEDAGASIVNESGRLGDSNGNTVGKWECNT